MRYLGILALAAAVLGGIDARAASDQSSFPIGQSDPLAQGESKRLIYSKELLKRELSDADDAICKRKVPEGNEEEKNTCHVTRNYLADIANKVDQLRPLMASHNYVITKAEWEMLKTKS